MKDKLYSIGVERKTQIEQAISGALVPGCSEITESLNRLDKIGKMSKEAFLGDQDAKDIAPIAFSSPSRPPSASATIFPQSA